MAKAVILKTNEGVLMVGAWQCSSGAYWDAEGCFNYCNSEVNEWRKKHQAQKLIYNSTTLGHEPKTEEEWYKNRENFIDIEIPYDNVNQEYCQEYIQK